MAATEGKLELPHENIKKKLDEALKRKGIVKYDVTLSAGSKPGDNYLSTVYKIAVDGFKENGEKANLNLFCKIPVVSKAFPEETSDAFLREIKVYEEILIEMKKLEIGKNIEDGFNGYAECVATGSSKWEEFVILEDISKKNFLMFDRLKEIDFNHTKLVMQVLGKLHAYSFALRDQKPEVLKKFSGELFEVYFRGEFKPPIANYLNNFLNSAVDKLKFDGIYQEKWENFHKNYFRVIKDCCNGELAEPYAVVDHGDCWNNNMMFKYEDGVPTEVCLLDWQICRYASPVLDIVYYIFCGTEKSFRDKHYQSLLQIYYESFSNCLKQLGSDPERLYPYSEFQNQLKKFGKFGLAMAIMAVPIMVSSSEDAIPIDEMASNATATTNNEKTLKIWTTRLTDCLKDLVDLGYL